MIRPSTQFIQWMLWLVMVFILPQPAIAILFHTENIQENDGLPSPSIKSITQDRWGIVWIATRSGIAFHNGLNWEKAKLDSLASDVSNGLLEISPQGHVWALLAGNDPTLLKHKFCSWQKINLPSDLHSSRLTFKHFALTGTEEQTIAAITVAPNLMYIYKDDDWYQVPLDSSTSTGIAKITDLIAMDGNFILATTQGAFIIYGSDPSQVHPLLAMQPPNPALCLSKNPVDNSLWLVGENWIGTFKNDIFEYLIQPHEGVFNCFSDPSTKICQTDGFGGIYMSGIFSSQYYHPETGMIIRGQKNGFLEFGTTDFFLDRELVLWQGTSQGIHKILSRHAAGYNQGQGLLADEVTALLMRPDGTVVVGHNNGLTFFKDDISHFSFPDYDFRDRVLDLAEDSQGNLWIAGRHRGLECLSPDGTVKSWELGLLPGVYTTSVMVDDLDQVWVAASKKLMVIKDNVISEVPLQPQIAHGFYLRRLIKGSHGKILIATGNQGLIAIQDNQIRQWKNASGSYDNSVFDALETEDGTTWVGTRNGLFQLAGHNLVRPVEAHLNITRPVYFIELDTKNRMWLGTDNGVLRVDGDQVTPLTVEEGMIGRETNRSASLVDTDGNFWVGTESGLTVFNDLFENTIPLPPLVYLVELETDSGSHTLLPGFQDIVLPSQTSNLVFHFRAFTTTESKRLKIRFKLDGIDDQWVESATAGEQTIKYNNVAPGTYQFHVKAAGFGQPWSEVASSPKITLQQPIWQHTWFLILAGLVLITLLALPVIFIIGRRYTIRLQNEVAKQLAANRRIESELEQARNLKALGLLAGGIAHDFNNLLTIIFGNLSLLQGGQDLNAVQQKYLKSSTGAIERARALTNQLLTFSKGGAPILKAGSLADLVRESAGFVLRGSSTKCKFQLPDSLWAVEMDSGQMSQVVNNLLMNAQEAMPAGGNVILRGQNREQAPNGLLAGKYVEITVTDNGLGISSQDLPKIFDPYFSTKEQGSGLGLTTAFSILEKHGGRLSAESTLGQGTTFKLLIPATNAPVGKEKHPDSKAFTPLKGSVLILDDDPEVRESLEHMLISLGMQVFCTAEGSQTVKHYGSMLEQGCPPDVVLMDLTIPGGLGGQDIIGPLLEIDPSAKAIVISGYSQNPVISQYKTHGFKAAIAKPIMVDELGNVLRRVLAD